jgi:hypothetical protein
MTDGVPIVLRKTLAARDTPTKSVPGRLIRYQQPKDCLQSNASLWSPARPRAVHASETRFVGEHDT